MRRTAWGGVPVTLVVAITAMGGTPALGQDASPGPSATPFAEPDASAGTGIAAAVPLAGQEGGALLEPGRYQDTSLGTTLTFDLGEGWMLAGPSIEQVGFALVRADEVGEPYLGVAGFDGTVFTDPCLTAENEATFGPAPESIDATAEGIIGHIAAHPFVTASEPVAVEIAGHPGLAIDVSAVDVPIECDPPWAWLWVLPVVNDYHLANGQLAHIVAFDTPNGVVVVSAEVFADGDISSFVEMTTALLDTLEVSDGS